MEYLLGLIVGLIIAALLLLLPDVDTDPDNEVRK